MLHAGWGLTQEGLKQIFELNPKGISHWKQQHVFHEFPMTGKLLWLEWRRGEKVKGYVCRGDPIELGGRLGLLRYWYGKCLPKP